MLSQKGCGPYTSYEPTRPSSGCTRSGAQYAIRGGNLTDGPPGRACFKGRLVPGPWSFVPRPWSLVHGPWSLVLALVPGPWSLGPGPDSGSLGPGPWVLVPIWLLLVPIWNPKRPPLTPPPSKNVFLGQNKDIATEPKPLAWVPPSCGAQARGP